MACRTYNYQELETYLTWDVKEVEASAMMGPSRGWVTGWRHEPRWPVQGKGTSDVGGEEWQRPMWVWAGGVKVKDAGEGCGFRQAGPGQLPIGHPLETEIRGKMFPFWN